MRAERSSVLMLLAAFSVAFAFGMEYAVGSRMLEAYLCFFISFASYFAAHYVETGSLVDEHSGKGFEELFEEGKDDVKALISFLSITGLAGSFLVLKGLKSSAPAVSAAGVMLIMSAYSAGHYYRTGKLL